MNGAEQALRNRLETTDFQCSFLVEAGAGAGKSHTICQRILHQLQGGRAPETIAAITFTEKAALELQEKLDRQALDYDENHRTSLAALTAKVHISTIHSFCQTALGLFPLETGGELQVLPDESGRARDFFRAWTARDESGAVSVFEVFGGSVRSLEDTFLAMAAEGHVPALPSAAEVQARQSALDSLTDRAHKELQKHLVPHSGLFAALTEELRQAAQAASLTPELSAALRRILKAAWKKPSSRPKRLRTLFFTGDSSVSVWLEEYIEASKKSSQKADPNRLGKVPPIFAAVDALQAGLDKANPDRSLVEEIVQAEMPLGYDLALNILAPALEAYVSERDRAGLVTFSGLLTRTRDLVRDNPAARALLHRRYQVFYVDEFQDTDPVQAELLFLITDRGGTETDWTRCCPAPGSLFLVGDPKQAIYRFRGADLGVYKQVKDLFTNPQSPVGEVVYLRANFRSAHEICSFVDQVFAPRDEDGSILSLAEQAKNRNSRAVTGFLDDGAYQAPYVPMEAQRKNQGAVFSYPARLSGNGPDDADRVARFIRHSTAGGFALPDRDGNPVPVRYGDFLILTWRKSSAGRYLDALSRLGIPVSFGGSRSRVGNCQMKRLTAWLQWLLEPGDEIALLSALRDCFGLENFESVRQLEAATQCSLTVLASWKEKRDEVISPALKLLLDALADMNAVLTDCRALPPMAFLEKLAEDRLFREGDASDLRERAQQYGDMRLFFSQLRQHPAGDFPALAQAALTLCQDPLERELPLAPLPDAVRVMNLHKAKGLEGKIVILTADTRASLPPQKALGVYPVVRSNSFGTGTLLYAPEDWSKKAGQEEACLAAERVRLDYVAATRAEQLLLIAGDQAGRNDKVCWQAMADKAPSVSAQDPQWRDFFAPLLDSNGTAPPAPAPTAGPAPQDLTASRESRIQTQSAPASLHASPSTLDKSHTRRPLDPEDPPEDSPVPEEAPEELETPEREENGPHGADWGTAVHRLLELCVSQKAWDEAAARPLVAQALRDTVPPLSCMTGTQKKLLFGNSLPESDEAGAERLAGQLEKVVSFWFDENSPLRRLAGEGTCYCELPFRLTLSQEDESWRFLRDRMDCQEDFGGSISVSGILDLAILTEEGWHIVDYKTDRLRPGEEVAAYCRRLAGEYEAQLNAYIRILSKLSGKTVLDARLCAIPLGGEWIPVSKSL